MSRSDARAIPRISNLYKFLTKPCPKAIGTVQCEIERIRITTRGKGVKSRLFPTYEYRLFIRNRPPSNDPPRRDTVLIVAKNRGRKHEVPGVMSLGASTKKGSNNYYLSMPEQADVDAHFEKVNADAENQQQESRSHPKVIPNGASQDPVLVSGEAGTVLGRLQSNFIGTEFQIFTPRARSLKSRLKHKQHQRSELPTLHFSSDEEMEFDNSDDDEGVSSDTNSSMSLSRFGRLAVSRRRNNNPASDSDTPRHHSRRGRSPSSRKSRKTRRHKRATSCPDLPAGRQARTNRRVANLTTDSSSLSGASQPEEPSFCEEEDGCITYTANLLGSRPRIMDVCIPKVTSDGAPGVEWRSYVESHADHEDECLMLDCFRQLQQRQEQQDQAAAQNPPAQDQQAAVANNNPPQPQPADEQENEENDTGDSDPSESQTGSDQAPDDFGLLPLQNRPPWWNIELESFVPNFGGRVSVASVKNFQLCHRHDQDRIMLQFGRIQGRHSFTMDFQHPLTAMQAFSIAISSLQSLFLLCSRRFPLVKNRAFDSLLLTPYYLAMELA